MPSTILDYIKPFVPHFIALTLLLCSWVAIYHLGPTQGWSYGTQLMGMIAIIPLYFVVVRIFNFSPKSYRHVGGRRMSYNNDKLPEAITGFLFVVLSVIYGIAFVALEIWLIYQGCTGGMELWVALVIAAALLVLVKFIYGLVMFGCMAIFTAIIGVLYLIVSAFSSTGR